MQTEKHHTDFHLIVNKQPCPWSRPSITGAEIKTLAGSPSDYVVNQIVNGPDPDPEIPDAKSVELDEQSEPQGRKRFITRKPATTPGAKCVIISS